MLYKDVASMALFNIMNVYGEPIQIELPILDRVLVYMTPIAFTILYSDKDCIIILLSTELKGFLKSTNVREPRSFFAWIPSTTWRRISIWDIVDLSS